MKKYHLPLVVAFAEMATYLYAAVKAIEDENLLEWSVFSKKYERDEKKWAKNLQTEKIAVPLPRQNRRTESYACIQLLV